MSQNAELDTVGQYKYNVSSTSLLTERMHGHNWAGSNSAC